MGNTIGFHGLKKRGHEGWGTGRKGRICSVRQEERGSVLEVIEEGKSWGWIYSIHYMKFAKNKILKIKVKCDMMFMIFYYL